MKENNRKPIAAYIIVAVCITIVLSGLIGIVLSHLSLSIDWIKYVLIGGLMICIVATTIQGFTEVK